MKIIRLIVIAILCFANQSQAQCFVLKVNMRDCALCFSASSSFSPAKTGLPAFAIFPTSYREDSADIEYAGKFSERGIKIIFNNNWSDKLNCDNSLSCVFGLNKEGKAVYSSSLKSIDSAQLKAFLLNNAAEKSAYSIRMDSFLYTNNAYGTIKILNATNKQLINSLRFADLDLQLLANKMPSAEKQRFEKYGTIINKKTSALLGKFQNFRVNDKGDLYVKVLFHNTRDSLTTNITDEHAILHYDARGNYKDVYLIELPEAVHFHDHDFLLANDDTIYAVTFDRTKQIDPEEPTSEINFIGRYVKKNGNYRFSDFVPYKLPYIYQLKFGFSYLGSGTSSYPLYVTKFSNSVYNIKTNKSVFIIDSAKYIAGIDTSYFNPEISIETNEKLNVRGISPVFGQSELYATPYLYENNIYIDYYTDKLEKKYTYHWGAATVAGKPIISAASNDGEDIFSVIYADEHKTWRLIAMPMSLFYSEK